MPQIQARFKIEGKPQRVFGFNVKSEKPAEQVDEIARIVAGEFGCHYVDVEVLSIGDDPQKLAAAPAPKKAFPTPSEVDHMKKANVIVLAEELGIEGDFDKLKVDQVRKLVNEKILDLLTAPAA